MGKISVNNVSALGLSMSVTVSTMTLIGTKLCQQCVSIGILHIHYCVNSNTNWDKIVSTVCQHWGPLYPLCVNNDTNWGKIVPTMCPHWDSSYPLLCQQ